MKAMIGIYCRTSVDRGAYEPETIGQQKEAGIAFAESNGFDYKVYEDEGKSGYKIEDEDNPFKNRPSFEELLSDIKRGTIKDVWVWSPTRLSRNNKYFVSILSYFEKNKITLYVQNARYEVDDPTTKAMLGMMGVFAEFDRQTIIANTHRGQVSAYNAGRNRYSALFGYKSEHDGKKIDTYPVPEELEVVKEIYDLYLNEHLSLGTIGQRVFIDKVKGKSKKLSNVHVVARTKAILQQFVYTSYSLKSASRDIVKAFRKGEIPDLQDLRKEEHWVKSAFYHEAVITREQWIVANERLQKVRQSISERNKGKTRERESSLCSGFLFCPECKVKYYYKDLKKKGGLSYVHLRGYEQCSNLSQFRMEKLDTIADIYYTFHYLILDNRMEQLEKNKNDLSDQKKEAKDKLKSLMSERDKKTRRIEKVEESLDSEEIENISVVMKQLDRLVSERTGIEEQIAETDALLQEIAKKEVEYANIEKYRLSTLDLLRHWFELREQNAYAELHNLLRESLSDLPMFVRKNIVSMSGVSFDLKHDYKIVYPFIEELLGIKLNKTYSEFEQIWIDAHQAEIKAFPEKVNDYLLHRFDSKVDYETFDLDFIVQSGFKFDLVMTTKKPDFKFLTSCFNPELYNNSIGLWTDTETKLANVKYYSASQIAEKLGIGVVSVREYGHKHGVLVKDKNRQFWTEDDLNKYITARKLREIKK